MIELVDVGLDHPRGGTPLVTGANLKVARGEVVLIVSAGGVGTSRIVAAALGELPVSVGRVEVLGRDVGKLRRSSLRMLRRRVGIVPQELCLMQERSALLNVTMPLEIDGIPRAEAVKRAERHLSLLGLEDEAPLPVDCLSASERQRVALARALVRAPDLVIADQPTTSQDARGADLVCTALEAAAVRGAACLVLGRDPMLREIAELYGWRQFSLADGQLSPIGEVVLDGARIQDALVDIESVPLPNVLPFPVHAAGGIG